MSHTIHCLFLLILSTIWQQQSYALFAASPAAALTGSIAASFPRGGGLGFGRRKGTPVDTSIDTDESEDDNTDEDLVPFDIDEV